MISDVAWGVFFIGAILWSLAQVGLGWRLAGLTVGVLAVGASTVLNERDELIGWWVELGLLAMVINGLAMLLAVTIGWRTGLHPVLIGGLVMFAGSGAVDGLITSFGDSFDEELTGTSTSLWIAGLIAVVAGFLLDRRRTAQQSTEQNAPTEIR
ncbi:hypothetical protein [Dactylosporangium sp. NPDC050588]|uniref:hypothetical protein n=1 Tax=Dactylosporangium sp. NPDC050588 TaxID=3157211 RepID=UPI0034074599